MRARLGDDTLILAEALVERVLGEDAEIEERMPGSDLLGPALRAALPVHHRLRRARPHRARGRLRLDGGRHRHGPHRPAFGEDDFRLATENGLTVHNPVRPDGTFDERTGPFAGHVRARRRTADRRGAARGGPPLPRRRVRALLSALLALRHAAHLLRQDELVHPHDRGQGPAARRQRDDQLAPRAHQARPLRQLAREQRRLGAVARALLGHAAAGLALRARATSCASARWPRSPSAAASRPTTCTGPTSTRSCSPARSAVARCAACPT